MAEAPPNRSLPPVVLWAVLLAALAGAAWQARTLIRSADFLPVHDFCEYWVAGELNLRGENPYDPQLLYARQKHLGLIYSEPIMMWNPPWTLSLVMPLALLPFRVAQLLFLLAEIGLVLYCADVTWRLYGGPPEHRWLSWLLAGTFLPTLFMVKGGQISAFLLVGAVGFLYFEQRGQLFLAGVLAAFLGIKPQLFYLFWFALLFWSIQRREWRIIAGGLCAGLLASLPPLLFNPWVFHQYMHAVTHYPPTDFMSLTLGTVLRMAAGEPYAHLKFAGTHFALQYVPTVAGLLLLIGWWWWRRLDWSWSEQMPLLLLVGMFTSVYGAWPSDLVLLLVPVLQATVWVLDSRQASVHCAALAVYLGINGLAAGQSLRNLEALYFFWMAPALLAGWLLVRWLARPAPLAASE